MLVKLTPILRYSDSVNWRVQIEKEYKSIWNKVFFKKFKKTEIPIWVLAQEYFTIT